MSKVPESGNLKDLEGLSERVVGEAIREFSFNIRLGVYTIDSPSFIQEKIPVIDGVKLRCVRLPIFDVSGVAVTDDGGRITWRLSDFVSPCDPPVHSFDRPLSFIATPHSDSPVYVTTKPNRGPFMPLDDVIVEVFTWDPTGSPVPRIGFSWRCRVPYHTQFE